jgi:hypothetical protein
VVASGEKDNSLFAIDSLFEADANRGGTIVRLEAIMPRSLASIIWLAPWIVLVPLGLAHCGPADGRGDGDDGGPAEQPDAAPMKQPDDSGMKQADDSGMKQAPDSGTKEAPDSGTKQAPDSGTKQQDDGAAPPADDGGTTSSPDAGGTTPRDSGHEECNGGCQWTHGYFCCGHTCE